jgi:hypothetical protein
LAQVAADHGMTEGALKSRVHALKTKFEPHWKRRERMFLVLLLFCMAVVAAIVWVLWPPEEKFPRAPGDPPPRTILDNWFSPPLVSHPAPVDSSEDQEPEPPSREPSAAPSAMPTDGG